jgi:hypothetical protein
VSHSSGQESPCVHPLLHTNQMSYHGLSNRLDRIFNDPTLAAMAIQASNDRIIGAIGVVICTGFDAPLLGPECDGSQRCPSPLPTHPATSLDHYSQQNSASSHTWPQLSTILPEPQLAFSAYLGQCTVTHFVHTWVSYRGSDFAADGEERSDQFQATCAYVPW